jgi:hypothetical protein
VHVIRQYPSSISPYWVGINSDQLVAYFDTDWLSIPLDYEWWAYSASISGERCIHVSNSTGFYVSDWALSGKYLLTYRCGSEPPSNKLRITAPARVWSITLKSLGFRGRVLHMTDTEESFDVDSDTSITVEPHQQVASETSIESNRHNNYSVPDIRHLVASASLSGVHNKSCSS